MEQNKHKATLMIMAIGVITLSVIAGTYAFFTAAGNAEGSNNITVQTENGLVMTLMDDNIKSINGAIDSQNLKFTTYLKIQNGGQGKQYAKLMFKNLVNTYSEDLVYSLDEIQSIPQSGNATVVKNYVNKLPVPTSSTASNQELSNGVEVNPGSTNAQGNITPNTQYYMVTIEYLYSDTKNQDVDKSAQFYTEFTMELGENVKTIRLVAGSGHTAIAPMQIIGDDTVVLPSVVENGEGITGWYSDPELTQRVTSTDVTESTQLYPKWESGKALYNPDGSSYTWQELIDNNYITVSDETLSYGTNSTGLQALTGSLIIDNSITSIGNSTFEYCRSLTSIAIPNSVTSIGEKAFKGCSSLTSITIPNSVTSIGYDAFNGIKILYYNGSVTSTIWGARCINPYVEGDFAYSDNTKTVLNTYIGNSTTVTIPNSVINISDNAFRDCSKLTSITIPDGVTSIGTFAFRGCSKLTSITIPDSVTSIRSWAFAGCSSLISVTFASTNGWKAGDTNLSSTDLANPSTAATYLTSTYGSYSWTRS